MKTFIFAAMAAMVFQFPATGSSDAAGLDRGWHSAGGNHANIILAQASDLRVIQLEEQVRQLTGRIEELNFLLLQMQEQVRRMQEDNDFRFQQLEDADRPADPERKSEAPAEKRNLADNANDAGNTGAPPRQLGEIVIGSDGAIKGATLDQPMDLRAGSTSVVANGTPDKTPDETIVASLPSTSDPEELYSNSYEFILSGDYRTAEAGFRQHIDRFPDDERSADAHYWLGEAILSQQRPAEAAEVFLAANRDFPRARKAPDTLLKLGMSLAALGQREVACATFKEISVRYPSASDLLKGRVLQEQAIAGC